ncbi:uncharacterized protein [Clytia hemisphaerica]|uniref:Major facilitator superfamily (MFS) profile domain-containing protein n=1 Tax=Clytia hemisphaerica TaxID=252671 RepID=A0A7M5X8T1_9CNID
MEDRQTEWKAKRKRTYIAFCVVTFGLGLEYSLVFPSLWFYINNIIQADYPKLFYGSALSAYPLASIIGAFTIGRYVDRTRKAKQILILLLICEIFGNLLYSLYFSPWCPFFGRLLSGFGDVCNMIITGEIARSYPKNEITKKLSLVVMTFSCGFIIAPGANILFGDVRFSVFNFWITYGNIPGLLMAFVFTIVLSVVTFLVHDISREFDLKQNQENSQSYEDREMKNFDEISDSEKSSLIVEDIEPSSMDSKEEMNHLQTLGLILKQPDLLLLLSFTFVASYILFGFDTLLSLIGSRYFGFSVKVTSLIFIIDGGIYFVVLWLLGYASKRCTDYHAIVMSFSILFAGLAAIFVLALQEVTNVVLKYSLLIVYLLAFSSTWTIEEVLSRSLFSKLVPSWCQNYAEGVRRSVSSAAFIISGVTSSGLFDNLQYLSLALLLVSFTLLVLFISRKKVLVNPTSLF